MIMMIIPDQPFDLNKVNQLELINKEEIFFFLIKKKNPKSKYSMHDF